LRLRELLQRTSAFRNPVIVLDCAAFSEKVEVEVEESGNEVPQPLVTLSLYRVELPFLRRLRLRGVESKNLNPKTGTTGQL